MTQPVKMTWRTGTPKNDDLFCVTSKRNKYPVLGGRFLIVDSLGEIEIATFYRPKKTQGKNGKWYTGYWQGYETDGITVIHWMPLPSLPKEGKWEVGR